MSFSVRTAFVLLVPISQLMDLLYCQSTQSILVSSCDFCARNIDLWFNKSVHVTSFTSRRVRFMSRTVLSDLLGFFWFWYFVLVNYKFDLATDFILDKTIDTMANNNGR